MQQHPAVARLSGENLTIKRGLSRTSRIGFRSISLAKAGVISGMTELQLMRHALEVPSFPDINQLPALIPARVN